MIAMVSSTSQPSRKTGLGGHVPGLTRSRCNTSAAGGVRLSVSAMIAVVAAAVLLSPRPAAAQQDFGRFLAGAAVGLGLHEAGHLTADVIFGRSPGVRKVSFVGIPFFAITHDPVSPAREFTISSAGFWVQHLSNEIILTRRPQLRDAKAPFTKGMLAFNVLVSVAYASAAFARAGPDERDTRGMAVAARISEPVVGVMILTPATLDALRYYFPERTWLRWASRAAKVADVLVVIRAAQ